jgi:hypothetical protein
VLLPELGLLGPTYVPSDLSRHFDQVPRRVRIGYVSYLDVPTLGSLLAAGHCSALLPASLAATFPQTEVLLKPVTDLAPVRFCAHLAQTSAPSLQAWVSAMIVRLAPPLG